MRVVRVGRAPERAQAAGDVQEVCVLRLEEKRLEGVRDEGGAHDVGGEGVFEPGLEVGRLGGHAGVVDERVEAAVFGLDVLHGGGDGGLVCDVELERGQCALGRGC